MPLLAGSGSGRVVRGSFPPTGISPRYAMKHTGPLLRTLLQFSSAVLSASFAELSLLEYPYQLLPLVAKDLFAGNDKYCLNAAKPVGPSPAGGVAFGTDGAG